MSGGRSERFGADDKLAADLGGVPLGLHAAQRLSDMGWAQKIAVAQGVMAEPLSDMGFNILKPATKIAGIGDNIATGAHALGDVDAVLIVLADTRHAERSEHVVLNGAYPLIWHR